MNMRSFQLKMCGVSTFLAIIAYVLVGYYTSCWTWSLFIFAIIPLMPFLVGLKKIHISYDLIIVAIYLVLGFTINGWHPWWVLFLTIPVYHIFLDDILRKRKKAREAAQNQVEVEIIDNEKK